MTNGVGFKILKWRSRTPLLAECERCHLKFITPERMLRDDPQDVEHYLREKHRYHDCDLRELTGVQSGKRIKIYPPSAVP
jgi:hypothetical protein